LGTAGAEERIGADKKRVRLFAPESCEGRIDLADRTRLVDLD
jgi:hypothetical protein